MKVDVHLADYAQKTSEQKIHAIGLGWTKTTSPLGAHAVVLFVDDVDGQVGDRHQLEVKLLDNSGKSVKDANGNEVGALAELRLGTDCSPMKCITSVLTLAPGLTLDLGVHRWVVTSPSEPEATWSRAFEVVASEDDVVGAPG